MILFFTARITDHEINDVTDEVSPNGLQHLFSRLNLSQAMVEHAEFGQTDSQLRGRAVLMKWRQQSPGEATKRAVLEALKKCRNLEARRALIEKWSSDT